MNTCLGIEFGGKNIKFAIAKVDPDSASLLSFSQFRAPTLHEGLYDLKMYLEKEIGEEKLRLISTVLVSSSAIMGYRSLAEGFREIESMMRSFIRDYSATAPILFISRDGNFYKTEEIHNDATINPRNLYKYVDAYWYSPVLLAKDMFELSDFIYVDTASSSTTIMPVVKGQPVLDLLENRLVSGKLIPIGILHTPASYLLNEVDFNGRRFRVYPYFPTFTSDIMVIANDSKNEADLEKAKLDIARFICEDPLFVADNSIKELSFQLYQAMKTTIRDCVKKVAREHFGDLSVPCVIVGSGIQLLSEALNDSKLYKMELNNAHGAIGLLYYYCKTATGLKLEIKSQSLSLQKSD